MNQVLYSGVDWSATGDRDRLQSTFFSNNRLFARDCDKFFGYLKQTHFTIGRGRLSRANNAAFVEQHKHKALISLIETHQPTIQTE